MASRPRTRAFTALQARRSLVSLDDDALLQVLLAAEQAGVLVQVASLSQHVCRVARSRVSTRLSVKDDEQARTIVKSQADGKLPFSGCCELSVSAPDTAMCSSAEGVLRAAQQWGMLWSLEVSMVKDGFQQQRRREQEQQLEVGTLASCAARLLSCVPALQQLRHLVLEAPALGAHSARHIMLLTQLTSLRLTAAKEAAGEEAAAADLCAMAGMTNLVELRLSWALAPHLPAGPEGPYCFPSSLVTLEVSNKGLTSPAPMARFVAHLPGCVQLQQLLLEYGQQHYQQQQHHHHSVHPRAVVGVLLQHSRRLRTLRLPGDQLADWTASVEGLPDAEEGVDSEWRPDDALAALTALEGLSSGLLCVESQEDWQHLVQLTALTQLSGGAFHWAPPLDTGASLAAVEVLISGRYHLGGYDLGCLLLACPLLRKVSLYIGSGGDTTSHAADAGSSSQAAAAELPLAAHPSINSLQMSWCDNWGDAAAAVAQFGELAPAVCGVSTLALTHWPGKSANSTAAALPDLSPCTALTSLVFECEQLDEALLEWAPDQEEFVSMVASCSQMQQLSVNGALWLDPSVVLDLQDQLPQLNHLSMAECSPLPLEDSYYSDCEEPELEELDKLYAQLREGMSLVLDDATSWRQ